MPEENDAFEAGRLIFWGFQPKERPTQNNEYRVLIQRFQRDGDFQTQTREFARGMGLLILSAETHGLILAPMEDSPFSIRPADFRARGGADDRLVDGLIQVTIAATIFPRPEDLEAESIIARPPTTVDEIESTLRRLCSQLAERAHSHADPTPEDEEKGLIEAWRAYDRKLSAKDTPDTRQVASATRRAIQTNLEKLVENDCFQRDERTDPLEYRPTWRYQVLVRELAATRIYQHAQSLLDREAA